jgi:hypothetical protein
MMKDENKEQLIFKEYAWYSVNLIAQAVNAMGKDADVKDISLYLNDLDAFGLKYFKHWLNRAHPNWQNKTSKLTPSLSEVIEIIRHEGWHENPIANGLIELLGEGGAKHQKSLSQLRTCLAEIPS